MIFCLQAEETYNDAMSSGFGAFMMNEDENTGKYTFLIQTQTKRFYFSFPVRSVGLMLAYFTPITLPINSPDPHY